MEVIQEKVGHNVQVKKNSDFNRIVYFRYPAILSVTVGSYEPDLNHSVSLSRPMSVLDEEITGDICSEASDTKSEELDMSYTISRSATADSTSKGNGKRYGSKLLPRLAGQVCLCVLHFFLYKHQLSF